MDAEQKQVEKEKKQLLRVMVRKPHEPITEWNKTLGWVNSKNNVDQTKINKRLKQLEADGLVVQIGHRYVVK